jgi:hypothetical protein
MNSYLRRDRRKKKPKEPKFTIKGKTTMKPSLDLGRLSNRTKAREFRAVKTVAEKQEEAAENNRLIEEWLAKGNLPDIGIHGPKPAPRKYNPAYGRYGVWETEPSVSL